MLEPLKQLLTSRAWQGHDPYITRILDQQPMLGIGLLRLVVTVMKLGAALLLALHDLSRDADSAVVALARQLQEAEPGPAWGLAAAIAFSPALKNTWRAAAAAVELGPEAPLAAESCSLQQSIAAVVKQLQSQLGVHGPGPEGIAAGEAAAAASASPITIAGFGGALGDTLQHVVSSRATTADKQDWLWILAGAVSDAIRSCVEQTAPSRTPGSTGSPAQPLETAWLLQQVQRVAAAFTAHLPEPMDAPDGELSGLAAFRTFCSKVLPAVAAWLPREAAAGADGSLMVVALSTMMEAVARGLAATWQRPAPDGWPRRQQGRGDGTICDRPRCDEADYDLVYAARALCTLQAAAGVLGIGGYSPEGLPEQQQDEMQQQDRHARRSLLLCLRSTCKLVQCAAASAASEAHGGTAVKMRLMEGGLSAAYVACAVAQRWRLMSGAGQMPDDEQLRQVVLLSCMWHDSKRASFATDRTLVGFGNQQHPCASHV